MPYLLVEDFKNGMDRRRRRVSGVPGSLWLGKNVLVTRGGDIERVRRFSPRYTLPIGTHGLARIREQPFVFGSADLEANIPVGVRYQRLQAPSGAEMIRILDARPFDGRMYAIAEYADGNIHHFFDGQRVSDWDTIADDNVSFGTLSDFLADKISGEIAVSAEAFDATIRIVAQQPGTPFTVTATATDGGAVDDQSVLVQTIQPNFVEVPETAARGTVTLFNGTHRAGINVVEQITAAGVDLLTGPVDWAEDSASTASALASAININRTAHGYSAQQLGGGVVLTAAAGVGASVNGAAVVLTIPAGSNVSAAGSLFSGGVDYEPPLAQVSLVTFSGTVVPSDTTDTYAVTVNGTTYRATPRASATGTSVFVRAGRVYSPANSLVRYCRVNDPLDWTTTATAADAGFINIAEDSEGSRRISAITDYNTFSAIFGEDAVFIYSLNANTDSDGRINILPNTGTRAPGSVTAYGNRDVFFLDQDGVRSIRARDSSGDAQADDVGTVIDPFIGEYLATLPGSALGSAKGEIEPKDKAFFLLVGDRIFIYSRFPSVQIAAWTYADPGFSPTGMISTARKLFVRDQTAIYLYGGETGREYDDAVTAVPEVQLPFMAAQNEASIKSVTGYDMAGEGTWHVEILPNPNDESQKSTVGHICHITYPESHIGLSQRTSHMAFNLTGASAGRLSLSSIAVHYTAEEQR